MGVYSGPISAQVTLALISEWTSSVNVSTPVNHLSWPFSPAAGGRATVQTYRAGPTHLAPTNIATSGTPAHN